MRTYSELMGLSSFEERFEYLKLTGLVGEITFGGTRVLSQNFYRSKEWKRIRRDIILRDNGCDLACPDRPIVGNVLIHHLEPITIDDVKSMSGKIVDPENLICVSMLTHNAIHYGSIDILPNFEFTERKPNDTCPWKEVLS